MDSSRLQIDNPGAPSANAARVIGAESGVIADGDDSAATGPEVAPARIGVLGVVS